MRYYYILRVDPSRRDYGQRDILVCYPKEIYFFLHESGAVKLGEGQTRKEAIADSRTPV
jgi:hypothetical protein